MRIEANDRDLDFGEGLFDKNIGLVLTSKEQYKNIPSNVRSEINQYLLKSLSRVPFYLSQANRYSNPSIENLYNLPLTFQDDLLKDPYQFIMSRDKLAQMTSSGGTYGKRKILFRTEEDFSHSVNTASSMFKLAGVNSADVVAIMQPFDLWNIGHIGMKAFKDIGALTIPLGLSTKEEETLDILAFTKTNVLYGTPSRVASLAALSESKGFLQNLRVSKVLCAGEPILKDHRELVKRLWNAEIFGIYGSEETDGMGAECESHDGYHLLDKNLIIEVLNPETMEPAEKSEGVIAVTKIGYEGTSLVRYLLGDKIQIIQDRCNCGSEITRVRPKGRLEETVWLYAGTKVATSSLEKMMTSFFNRVPIYQIVVEKAVDGDTVTLRINDESNPVLADTLANEAKKVSQDLENCVDTGKIRLRVDISPDLSNFDSTIRGKMPKIIYKRRGEI